MAITDDLSAALKEAMKAKDKPKLDAIRQIQTEVAKKKAEKGLLKEKRIIAEIKRGKFIYINNLLLLNLYLKSLGIAGNPPQYE